MTQELLEAITTRRSIRTYQQNQVPESLIHELLKAAQWAPSAHNAQPWRFIVITDNSVKRELAESMAREWIGDLTSDGVSPGIRRGRSEGSIKCFTHAPVLIVSAITMEEMDRYPDEKRQHIEHTMAIQSLAVAVQNLLLAAHAKGLGSCWFCAPLFCQDTVRRVLGIPAEVEPQALITLGYPAEQPEPPPRKSLKEIAFKDRWSEGF